jgi:hypothetical protein
MVRMKRWKNMTLQYVRADRMERRRRGTGRGGLKSGGHSKQDDGMRQTDRPKLFGGGAEQFNGKNGIDQIKRREIWTLTLLSHGTGNRRLQSNCFTPTFTQHICKYIRSFPVSMLTTLVTLLGLLVILVLLLPLQNALRLFLLLVLVLVIKQIILFVSGR